MKKIIRNLVVVAAVVSSITASASEPAMVCVAPSCVSCLAWPAVDVPSALSAPDEEPGLVGTWEAKVKSLAQNMQVGIARHIDGCDMFMTLDEERMSVRCNIYGSAMFQGVSISVGIRAQFGADYVVEGDSLLFDYGDNELDVDVYSVHVNADENVRSMMDAMGINESGIREMLTDRVRPDNFRDLMGYIGDRVAYQLKDKKTLILTDSAGRQLQFTRKKNKKK